MGDEQLEQRVDPRYESAEKAALMAEGTLNRLAIIRNVSRGGAFISLIGSHRAVEHDTLELLIRGSRFRCRILLKENRGLHCKFTRRLAEREPTHYMRNQMSRGATQSRMLPAANAPYFDPFPEVRRLAAYTNTSFPLIGDHPDSYVAGWSAGIVQLDVTDDLLNATVAALTSHLGPMDKEQWMIGFNDALRRRRRIAALPT